VLALLQRDPEEFLPAGSSEAQKGLTAEQIEVMIDKRNAARRNKDFAEADRIRDELAAQGVVLEDGANGTSWRRD
jgi:cysteinyl-tRNA synthetase